MIPFGPWKRADSHIVHGEHGESNTDFSFFSIDNGALPVRSLAYRPSFWTPAYLAHRHTQGAAWPNPRLRTLPNRRPDLFARS